MVELPSELKMKTKKVLIFLIKLKKLLLNIYHLLKWLKAYDDNYGSLCEECLTSLLLRHHVITHPCSDILTKPKR